jgi:hydrogenase maturation factor
VDVSGAKIVQGQDTITTSNLSPGDSVIVQGTVNGNSITASSLIDQAQPAEASNSSKNEVHRSFLGGIGQFFMHLFGF